MSCKFCYGRLESKVVTKHKCSRSFKDHTKDENLGYYLASEELRVARLQHRHAPMCKNTQTA
ncbi:hypothetical protein [uncultured Helicobacter sp.]|uniref:hypothetical protein n=1 Tax=uncultured Helicobacter sp. TaxID=175537 RepID=UPI00374F2038